MSAAAVARVRTWSLRVVVVGVVLLVAAQTVAPTPALFLAAAVVVALGLLGFAVALVLRRRAARL